ncbi:MAG TPA: glycerate kinase, partial [Jiangellaceae bacterium]|nr:glycerate kinase [Jiangellaceae bacterium]
EPSGGNIGSIVRVDLTALHPRARDVRWRIAVDVTNPLTGPNGAAAVYGPQKGAGSADVQLLDDGLASLARVLQAESHADLVTTPGMGAAGGVPLSMLALLDAEITPGAALVAEAVGLPAQLAEADVVITGEGRLDKQSISGKVVSTLAALTSQAATTRRPTVVAIAGSVDLSTEQLRQAGVDAAFSIANGAASMTDLVRDSELLVRRTAAAVAGLISSHRR